MGGLEAGPASKLYPSYKSFDALIDVPRLRSLDAYITDRIRKHISRGEDDFFVNQHCLDRKAPYKPGLREVCLTRTAPGTPYNYLDINRSEFWSETAAAVEFTLLMDLINDLPFKSKGRIILIYDEGGKRVPAHRDHKEENVCHDFIWLRANLRKRFYLLNQHTGEKRYVEGYSAWFDTVNQYHGSDAAEELTFSIRVDGHFNEELKRRIPYCKENAAATPAVWATRSEYIQ